jgi:hypothetical protein
MFLGAAPNHAPDVFRFLNLETKKVIVSGNVIWLDKCYGDWKKLGPLEIEYVADEGDKDDPEPGRAEETDGGMDEVEVEGEDGVSVSTGSESEEEEQAQVAEPTQPTPPVIVLIPPTKPRMTREMRRLEGFYNPAATAYMNQA